MTISTTETANALLARLSLSQASDGSSVAATSGVSAPERVAQSDTLTVSD